MKWFPWAALAVLVGLLSHERYLTGKAMDRLATNAAVTRLLEQEADSLRALVHAGAAELDTTVIPRWRILRDTLTITDTVQVRAAFAVADSTINECRRVLSDCEQLAAVERARADSLAVQRDIWKGLARPRFTWHGYGATDLRGGLYAGVEARLRLFGLETFGRAEQRLDSAAANLRLGVVVRF